MLYSPHPKRGCHVTDGDLNTHTLQFAPSLAGAQCEHTPRVLHAYDVQHSHVSDGNHGRRHGAFGLHHGNELVEAHVRVVGAGGRLWVVLDAHRLQAGPSHLRLGDSKDRETEHETCGLTRSPLDSL